MTTIRSGVTPDGQRVFIEQHSKQFRIGTRWAWLAKFDCIKDAVQAFEVIEFCEGDLCVCMKAIKAEMRRTNASRVAGKAMAYTWYLLDCVERRLIGLRPVLCGSKGSIVEWRKA